MATVGVEVNNHKHELLPILRKIAAEHGARCDACELPQDSDERMIQIMVDGYEAMERPKQKAAAGPLSNGDQIF